MRPPAGAEAGSGGRGGGPGLGRPPAEGAAGKLADVPDEVVGTSLLRFAEDLRRDGFAVQNALELPWAISPVEGQASRIEPVKRAMYGRAEFDLPRRRVLLAA